MVGTKGRPGNAYPPMPVSAQPERGRNEEEELATRRAERAPSARLARCFQERVYLIPGGQKLDPGAVALWRRGSSSSLLLSEFCPEATTSFLE